jgi:esterase
MNHAVFVHGFMGSALNWGPILTRLRGHPACSNWQFQAVDLLGHGGRRGLDALPYSELGLDIMTQDLALQIPSEPFVGIGHSFGLRPLLKLAAAHPHRVSGLVVEDSSPEISPESRDRLIRIVESVPVPFASREVARTQLATLYPQDPRLAAFLLSNLRAPSQGTGLDWRFDKAGLLALLREAAETPLWPEWAAFEGPIDLIQGERSDFLTSERLAKAQSKRGDKPLQIHQIAQSGHWIHSEQPEAFTELVVQILQQY